MKKVLVLVTLMGLITPNLFAAMNGAALSSTVTAKVYALQKEAEAEKVSAYLSDLAEKHSEFAAEINAVRGSHARLVEAVESGRDSQSLLYVVESLNEDLAILKLKNYDLYQKAYEACNHAYGSMRSLGAVSCRAENCLNGYGSLRSVVYYEASLMADEIDKKGSSKDTLVSEKRVLKEFEIFKKLVYNLDYYSYEAMFTAMQNLRNAYVALYEKKPAVAKSISEKINEPVEIAGGAAKISVESYVRMESIVLYRGSEHSQCAMRNGDQERELFDTFQELLSANLKN